MSTIIHTAAMPPVLTALAGTLASGTTAQKSGGLGFWDLAAAEVLKKNGSQDSEEKDTGFLTDQMSLAQYKKYISGRISSIQVDPSRALESLTVKISDAGFQAMKDDPEYEAWVLGQLEAAWSLPNVSGSYGGFTTYSIGADPDSFKVSTVDLNSELEALEKLEDLTESFWESRQRRQEEYIELAQREAFLRRLRNGTVSTAELLLSGLL